MLTYFKDISASLFDKLKAAARYGKVINAVLKNQIEHQNHLTLSQNSVQCLRNTDEAELVNTEAQGLD